MNRSSLIALLLVISLSACKKDKAEEETEELPAFGSCDPVSPAGGFVAANQNYPFIFRTSGGGTIEINPDLQIVLKYDAYPNFKLEYWGSVELAGGGIKTSANHENLNGKHIKDRIGTRRTIIFPDGAKITMIADGPEDKLSSIDIYDGAGVHHINPSCNTLEYSVINADVSRRLDELQPDGETSSFEITNTGLMYFNLYIEEEAGKKVEARYNLGEIYSEEPNRVNDYYDDSRLNHTQSNLSAEFPRRYLVSLGPDTDTHSTSLLL